ncbi:MAG: hypothetical protein ABI593_16755, partial [Betaproteobacteria bacterium]
STWFLSPYQYLTYISRVVLTFEGHKLVQVRGRLVPVDAHMPNDAAVARRVATMERALEHDPLYAPLFATVGTRKEPMPVEAFAKKSVAIMRDAVHADLALSTASSFRQALPRGRVTLEALRAATLAGTASAWGSFGFNATVLIALTWVATRYLARPVAAAPA